MNKSIRDKIIGELTNFYWDMMLDWKTKEVVEQLIDIYTEGFKSKGWNQMTDDELIKSAEEELECFGIEDEEELKENALYCLIQEAKADMEAHKLLSESSNE